MSPSVVITGSTHGIGYFMAQEFLGRGCPVVISGRTQQAVDEAVAKLTASHNPDLVHGTPCDVTDFNQMKMLWDYAYSRFGHIDIWINNAGTSAPMMDFWELSQEQYDEVVRTNILGTMYGSKIALAGMLAQGYGALYNMEGFGARGGSMRGVTLYGSTKAGVHFINRGLAAETKGTPIIVGAIAPGMMITEMVTRQFEGREKELEGFKRILNIIAERPETVAPVLVEKILSNKKNGATIAFSSRAHLITKFITAPFKKRDLFS